MNKDKTALRRKMAAIRDAMPPAEREERSFAACRHAMALLRERLPETNGRRAGRTAAQAVLVYVPFRSEADTWPLIRLLWQSGVPVAAPRTDKASRSLALYRIHREGQLKPGAFGIAEPDPARCEPVPPTAIGAMIVPGLAFDRKGGRLGYGAGYYDRLFRLYRARGWPMPLRIGFAFAAQLVDDVPTEGHDVPMDRVVTEEGVVRTDGTDG